MRNEGVWTARANVGPGDKLPKLEPAAQNIKSLQHAARACLSTPDIAQKVALTNLAAGLWFERKLSLTTGTLAPMPHRPGRPENPILLPPSEMKKRSIHSEQGRIALVHAIAHIELNAMDLAWDIIGRFSQENGRSVSVEQHQRMPRSFYDGWVQVALEEAKHFSMLQYRLQNLGSHYGALPAHDGLWEAAQSTVHSITARLAIVPLVLEARGLDITPSLISQVEAVGDEELSHIFKVIYRDEQKHVAVGIKWFRYLCDRQKMNPAEQFQILLRKHFRGSLKPPFNDKARSAAGFTPLFYRSLTAIGRTDR